MTTLRVKIEPLDDTMAAVARAWKAADAGEFTEAEAVLSFPSFDLLHRLLTPKRLDIVRVMAGQGHISIREIARRVGRDFKGVHTDVEALLSGGVIDKAEKGGVVFPYERLHFEFDIEAAA